MHDRSAPDRALIAAVEARLIEDRPVRRKLPGGGRVHIDRQLPFLCLYRSPSVPEQGDAGTRSLVTGFASYLAASADRDEAAFLRDLTTAVVQTLAESFGAFLLVEVRTHSDATARSLRLSSPGRASEHPEWLGSMLEELARVSRELQLDEEVVLEHPTWKSLDPPLTAPRARAVGCRYLQIEVPPLYRDPTTGTEFPEELRRVRRALRGSLERVFHRFSCESTLRCPVNHHMLGRRGVVKAVWKVDAILAEVSESFDFLLQVTPTNAGEAWDAFKKSEFTETPRFRYRPLSSDPIELKRKIWSAPVEKIEDPTLSDLLRQKQEELDRQVTLLSDRETPRFVWGASQVFGDVSPELLELAESVLAESPVTPGDDTSSGGVGAEDFAERARAEIAAYAEEQPEFQPEVEVREDVGRGLIVSGGRLLVGAGIRVPENRVDALLHHEIGTHLLTNYNGRKQKFRLLASGLAGYDPFQEGIAVLSEHWVGGLTPARLRLLAARVVGVAAMLRGESFSAVHRLLNVEHGFEARTAFTITMRIFRGGGLTKDAAYLRGLVEVFDYLREGGDVPLLWTGKFAATHAPLIRELRFREIVSPPELLPRAGSLPDAKERLERVVAGASILDLVRTPSP